jgi:metal-sulfur cluster biosynthetic enzyme
MTPAAAVTRSNVEQAIGAVLDPCSIAMGRPMDLVTMGLINDVEIDDGHVTVRLLLTDPMCFVQGDIARAIEEVVRPLAGVRDCTVRLDTADIWTPDRIRTAAR